MRGIVQYEVYALDQGRWSLHARYPGAQRTEAIMDASATESLTGRATKVVRDTYWAETNENEEITTYLSPKARTLQALASTRRALTPAPSATAAAARPTVPQNRRKQQRANALLRNVRLIVALGMGLFIASAITAAVSVGLHRVAEQYHMDDGNFTILLTVTYLLVFTYVFRRASRTRMRLHQIIAEMWENTDRTTPKYPPRRAMGRAYRGAPRQPWQMLQERRAPRQETPPPPSPAPIVEEEEAAPAPPPPPPVLAMPPIPPKPPEAKPTPAPQPAKAATAVGVETADAKPREAFIPPAALEIPPGLSLERIILRRFAIDVVMPAVSRTHRDDPVTRRGIALLLAGAVQGLSETNPVTQNGAMALLAEALREAGSKAAAIESFLGNYETSLAAVNSQPLIAAGRTAIAGYVDGARGVDHDIQQALAVWRFPSNARLVPTKPEFYLFSIAREESLTDGEPTTGLLLHHAIVRGAAQEFAGEIVPHDAAGMLVRFTDAGPAFTAARTIQSRILAAAGPGTATVVVEGPVTVPGVPQDIASVLERARALLAVTVDGEVVSDAKAHRTLADETVGAEPVGDRTDAVRVVENPPA
jgi:hypothetical protein